MDSQSASGSSQSEFLKPFWTALFGPPWLVSLIVLAVLASVRFFAFFGPYSLQETYAGRFVDWYLQELSAR